MPKLKPLTPIHHKAAHLIADGATEHQVATLVGRSRSWVQQIKSNPLVAQLNRIKAQLNPIDSTAKLSIPIDWEDFALASF